MDIRGKIAHRTAGFRKNLWRPQARIPFRHACRSHPETRFPMAAHLFIIGKAFRQGFRGPAPRRPYAQLHSTQPA